MIPRIQTGTSFKGAELYYLHDKRAEGEKVRETKERVTWTYAINTLEDEPEAVLAEMRHTAFNQYLLKWESGNRVDGRPTEKPVMTVALSWPRGENPTRDDMIETGHSFLQHMKWEGHQVLFVAHSDTKHPHVHLIINRVHPETGMTQDAAWTKHRSQQWALAYERERGHIYCEKRERKYGRDRTPAPRGMTQGEWKLWQEIAKDGALDPEFEKVLQAGEWDALKGNQRDSRLEFWKETGRLRNELRDALREDVRAEFAPQWAAYAREKMERDEKLKLYDRETRHAIRELRKQRGPTRTPRPKETSVQRGPDGRTYIKQRRVESEGIEQLKQRRKAYHARHREELWEMRSAIATLQKDQLGTMMVAAEKQFGADRKQEYDHLLATQRGEKSELRQDQRAGDRRRDVLQGQTREAHLTPEQTASYIADARRIVGRDAEREQARREITDADRAREAGQDPQAQKAEAHDRTREKKDKDQAQEGKRQSDRDWYLAKRALDRAKERDGGRDR